MHDARKTLSAHFAAFGAKCEPNESIRGHTK